MVEEWMKKWWRNGGRMDEGMNDEGEIWEDVTSFHFHHRYHSYHYRNHGHSRFPTTAKNISHFGLSLENY